MPCTVTPLENLPYAEDVGFGLIVERVERDVTVFLHDSACEREQRRHVEVRVGLHVLGDGTIVNIAIAAFVPVVSEQRYILLPCEHSHRYESDLAASGKIYQTIVKQAQYVS